MITAQAVGKRERCWQGTRKYKLVIRSDRCWALEECCGAIDAGRVLRGDKVSIWKNITRRNRKQEKSKEIQGSGFYARKASHEKLKIEKVGS